MNTGGMGAFGPVPWLEKSFNSEISQKVVKPLLKTMKERGTPFKGILFFGADSHCARNGKRVA